MSSIGRTPIPAVSLALLLSACLGALTVSRTVKNLSEFGSVSVDTEKLSWWSELSLRSGSIPESELKTTSEKVIQQISENEKQALLAVDTTVKVKRHKSRFHRFAKKIGATRTQVVTTPITVPQAAPDSLVSLTDEEAMLKVYQGMHRQILVVLNTQANSAPKTILSQVDTVPEGLLEPLPLDGLKNEIKAITQKETPLAEVNIQRGSGGQKTPGPSEEEMQGRLATLAAASKSSNGEKSSTQEHTPADSAEWENQMDVAPALEAVVEPSPSPILASSSQVKSLRPLDRDIRSAIASVSSDLSNEDEIALSSSHPTVYSAGLDTFPVELTTQTDEPQITPHPQDITAATGRNLDQIIAEASQQAPIEKPTQLGDSPGPFPDAGPVDMPASPEYSQFVAENAGRGQSVDTQLDTQLDIQPAAREAAAISLLAPTGRTKIPLETATQISKLPTQTTSIAMSSSALPKRSSHVRVAQSDLKQRVSVSALTAEKTSEPLALGGEYKDKIESQIEKINAFNDELDVQQASETPSSKIIVSSAPPHRGVESGADFKVRAGTTVASNSVSNREPQIQPKNTCDTAPVGKEAFTDGKIEKISVCRKVLSFEGDKNKQESRWYEALESRSHIPTILWQKEKDAFTDEGTIPLLSQNNLKLLSAIARTQIQGGMGIVFGKAPADWELELSSRAEQVIYFDNTLKILSTNDVSQDRYFAFLNVIPGSPLLYLSERRGDKSGAIALIVKPGEATFVNVEKPKIQDLRAKIFDASSPQLKGVGGLKVEIIGQPSHASLSNSQGGVLLSQVLTFGDFPNYVDVSPNSSSYKHRYAVSRTAMKNASFFYFNDNTIQQWVGQLEGGVSPSSGLIVGALPKLLKENKKSFVKVTSLEKKSTLSPEIYPLGNDEHLETEPKLTEKLPRFIGVQIPEGVNTAVAFDEKGNSIWSQIVISQPGVINVLDAD